MIGEDKDAAVLRHRVGKLESILEVAKSLAAQHDLDELLSRITDHARDVAEAQRGTIFMFDREHNELWSRVAHGSGRIRFPADRGIAGHVATTKSSLNIPDAYADERFNKDFDRITGFRTRQLLAVPMLSTPGEVVGVLEVLNRKPGSGHESQPFDREDEELLLALGGQAAGAIENAILYAEINRLFEGFIKASVLAIESRDPSTRGHSERVADLTCALAEAVNRVEQGPLAAQRFDRDALRELRYSGLLHDFGKVGVREHVLVKADKLYPADLAVLSSRFEVIRATMEKEAAQRKAAAAQSGDAARLGAIDAELQRELAELADIRGFVLECNKPAMLQKGGFERLQDIARRVYPTDAGPQPYLTEAELKSLSIPRGSLTEADRLEIESHVTHTSRFLSAIPWIRSLRRVPEIAGGHHEKLDGGGYPNRLNAAAIALESRMMAICDVYDALTASDRPYKPAMPAAKALEILRAEARGGKMDADLVELFISAKVYERRA